MNTLHIDLGQQWRGGQNQALLLLAGLVAQGDTAELIAPRDSPLAERARAAGLTVHGIPTGVSRLHAALEVRRRLSRRSFDVLHCHDAHSLTAAWLAGAHRRTAVVAARRVPYPLSRGRIAKLRYNSARRIIAVSEFVKGIVAASGVPQQKIEVIYDGVQVPDPSAFRSHLEARRRLGIPASEDVPVLGSVGYLVPDKGQDLLIQALPAVQQRYPGCRLLLAGGGPCRSALEQLAAGLGVAGSVTFLGIVGEVAPVYQALDAYLATPVQEGLGSSLLSAMAYGLPVITTASGAMTEVIQDGFNGYLVERDPASLAQGALRLLDDPLRAARFGAAGRSTVMERFSTECMIRGTQRLYRTLCSPAGSLAGGYSLRNTSIGLRRNSG